MLVRKNAQKLLLNLRDPTTVTAIIPTATTVEYQGHTLTVVPHRIPECRLLKNLGFDAPHPVDFYYDWPGRWKPTDAQKQSVKIMTLNRRVYNLSEIGSGKTLASLWAFDYLKKAGLAERAIIAAPLSTLERTWGDEIFTHFMHLSFEVVYGDKRKRKQLLNTPADVYIINHDGVKILIDDLIARNDISVVIIDELSQVARNANTDRWKVLRQLVGKREYVWGLTGTPIPNDPTDAWAQCRLITPETVPPYFGRFRDMTMQQVSTYKWQARPEALDIVYQAMQPAVRAKRNECFGLPPVIFTTRKAALSPEQASAFKAMRDNLYAQHKNKEILAVNEGVKLMKLVQICAGAAYSEDGSVVSLSVDPRLAVVKELIEEADAKVIVFVPFRAALENVVGWLRQYYTAEAVYGGVAKGARDRIFGDFQKSPDPKVLVAQPSAMSHGLTLTAASVIIWFAPITSAETYEQANGRITRPGQKNKQLVVNIVGTRLEEQMYDRLKQKTDTQGLLLDMFK